MAGAIPANYSGVHSKRTQPIVGFGTHFCKDPPTAGSSTTARHGKKTRSTPLGCRTTQTFTNGNGNRRCDNLLAKLTIYEIASVLVRFDHIASGIVNRISTYRMGNSRTEVIPLLLSPARFHALRALTPQRSD